jgi:hypothetical protein
MGMISECVICGDFLRWGREYREHMEKHYAEVMQ